MANSSARTLATDYSPWLCPVILRTNEDAVFAQGSATRPSQLDCSWEALKELGQAGPLNFFNLLSYGNCQLILRRTGIRFVQSDRPEFSVCVPFTRKLRLELPTLRVPAIFQNAIYYSLYLHNIHAQFISSPRSEMPDFGNLADLTINVINLSSRPDRWHQVSSYPLEIFKVSRHEATKGRPGLGWEGCALSHIALVERAREQESPYIIVAEDDFANTVDWRLWERRLVAILQWLSAHPLEWDVFNGHPCGPLVDSPIRVMSRELGIVEMPGGLNTHFIVYNASAYDKVIAWRDAYDPDNELPRGHRPSLDQVAESKLHLLAIDEWLSSRCCMVTSMPLLTCSSWDDSDVIGSHCVDCSADLQLLERDYQAWLARVDYRLTLANRRSSLGKQLLGEHVRSHSYKFYEEALLNYELVSSLNADQRRAHFAVHSQVLSNFYDVWRFARDTEPLFGGGLSLCEDSDVTVVCTSCGRWSCLYKTLSTFHRYNSYAVKQVYVVEDSGSAWMASNIRSHFPWVTLLYDGERHGQARRVRQLWSLVDTRFLFHMEDDWRFHHPFFIDASLRLLRRDPKLISAWLRDVDDTNLHPVSPALHEADDLFYWTMEWDYDTVWHGFTLSPSLFRTEEVLLAAEGSCKHEGAHAAELDGLSMEVVLGSIFRSWHMRAAILPGGFVSHIGAFSTANGANWGTLPT